MIDKIYNRITKFIFALVATAGFMACSNESYDGIKNHGEVKIIEFNVANSKLNTIDQTSASVQLIFPSNIEITGLSPQYKLSEGAKVIIPEDSKGTTDNLKNPEGPIDLSIATTYRVINGNLYKDYMVQAFHVKDVTQISAFSIGKYRATINHEERTITLPYPADAEITSLTPTVAISEGAFLEQPTSLNGIDFTNPVNFILTYLDETFTYVVTVVPTNMSPKGFIGANESASEISNESERAAWQWFQNSFEGAEYVSFKSIKEGTDLTRFGALWYHWDSYNRGGDPTPHELSNQPEVIEALNNYLYAGKGLFLSSAGMALGKLLDISKDRNMWNNAWGFDSTPFKVNDDNGIGWGIRFIDHPIFQSVRKPAGESNRCFLLGNGSETYARNVRWNLKADWTPQYLGREKWMETTGATQLATLHWDDTMEETSVFTEFERNLGRGAVITCGAECYDWYDTSNSYLDNLETITFNILNYISE